MLVEWDLSGHACPLNYLLVAKSGRTYKTSEGYTVDDAGNILNSQGRDTGDDLRYRIQRGRITFYVDDDTHRSNGETKSGAATSLTGRSTLNRWAAHVRAVCDADDKVLGSAAAFDWYTDSNWNGTADWAEDAAPN